MQYGIDDGTDVVRSGSSDTQKFLDVTSEQLEYILVTNYKQLSDQLELILRGNNNYISFLTLSLSQYKKIITYVQNLIFVYGIPHLRIAVHQM